MANDLEFRIGAELTEIKGALAQLRRDFTAVGNAANQAGGRADFSKLERGITGAVAQVRNLVAAFAALGGAIALIRQADELTTLNARLRLVTGSAEEFAAVQERIFELAQRSRAPLAATVDLYAKIGQATKDAGVGQETLLSIVETINQAVQLSGASAQAAEAALVQLGQGLGSGTLRGEELNSVLEQTPVLADAIAKGMGITRAELRKYGEEGKITSKAVIDALIAQKGVIAEQFNSLPLTVGQATTQLGNSLQRLLGVFNETTGATGGLAEVIGDLARYLASDDVTGAIIEFAATWGNAFKQIVDDFNEAIDIIKQGTVDFAGTGEDAVELFSRAFRELPVNLRTSIQIATVAVAAGVDKIVAAAVYAKEALAAIFTDDTIDAASARYKAQIAAISDAARSSIDQTLQEREKALGDAKKARQDAQDARERSRSATLGSSRGTFKPAPAKNAADAGDIGDAASKLLKDQTERALRELDNLNEQGLVALRVYYTERGRIAADGIQAEIDQQQKVVDAAQAGSKDRLKAETELTLLKRRQVDVLVQAERDAARARREIDQQLEQARAQDLENQGRSGEAARIRLEAQFRDLLKRLEADGNKAGADLIRKLIDTGAAKARFDELKAQFDRVAQQLQARQEQLANQRDTGAIAPETAQQGVAAARQQALEQMRAINAEIQALAADPNALPAVKQAAEEASAAIDRLAIDSLTGLDAAIVELRASLANLEQGFAQSATGAGVDALTNLFTDLASGTKSAGDSLKDFVRTFAASMAQIAARALATYAVLQLLDAIYPGLGKAVSVGASVNHSGGVIGHGGGVTRRVDPALFFGAPRYHSGGMVGLKPDERPAILQTGEEVLARNDPRNAANGGGQGGGSGYRIVNVLDPSLVSGYLESSAGEKAVLNVIGRNPSLVKQSIGA